MSPLQRMELEQLTPTSDEPHPHIEGHDIDPRLIVLVRLVHKVASGGSRHG